MGGGGDPVCDFANRCDFLSGENGEGKVNLFEKNCVLKQTSLRTVRSGLEELGKKIKTGEVVKRRVDRTMPRSSIQFAALLLALVVCSHAIELPAKKVPLTRDQLDQIKEAKEADQFQAQVDQLNDKVFPVEDKAAKGGEWTHESADAMQKHWENIASRDSGVALDEPAKPAAKAATEHKKMMRAKHAEHRAMMQRKREAKLAQHEAAKHEAAKPETAKPEEKEAMHPAVEHAHKKWLKPHAKLWHVPEVASFLAKYSCDVHY